MKAKSVVLKKEFDEKLKELRIKTKFMNTLKEEVKRKRIKMSEKIEFLNEEKNFEQLILGAFVWPDNEIIFWNEISQK